MAVCPKCGKKLRITQWRPECPYCSVNMIYYNANDRLLAETEFAEIEHAKNQPKIDRAKAAFFGSPPAIARIVITVLPIAALFLPLIQLIRQEYVEYYSIIQIITSFVLKEKAAIISGAFGGNRLYLSVFLLLVSVIMIIVCLCCLALSLSKHGKIRNYILDSVMIGSALASALLFISADGELKERIPELSGAKLSFGAAVYILLLVVVLVYNIILVKKGLKVKYTQCLVGGLPSEEYFAMVEAGESELNIKKKMVEALTVMQDEVRRKAAEDEAKAQAERESRK